MKGRGLLFITLWLLVIKISMASQPWFTGPLLAPESVTSSPRQFFIQPYFNATNNYKTYNNNWHAVDSTDLNLYSFAPSFGIGLTDWIDFVNNSSFSYNYAQGERSTGINDPQFFLGFQLLRQQDGSTTPNLRFAIGESIPIGRFDNLSSPKKSADLFGSGTFLTLTTLSASRLDLLSANHYLQSHLSVIAGIPSPRHVQNLNAYGGGSGTDGRITPGITFSSDLAFEYQLTQNWVSVFESYYFYTTKNRFSGTEGAAPVGGPPAAQLSFAPAIEYNFSSTLGVIWGCWFSVLGKNSASFLSSQFSIVYTGTL